VRAEALAEEAEAHRKAGSETRPGESGGGALELVFPFAADRFVDDGAGRRGALLRVVARLVGVSHSAVVAARNGAARWLVDC